MTGGVAVEFVTESAASQVVLLAAVLTAAGVLLRYLWRAVKMGEAAFVQLVGTKDEPSLRATIAALAVEVSATKKELHPNGGGSMRDELRKVQHDITNIRAGQEMLLGEVDKVRESAQQATTAAAVAVGEAKRGRALTADVAENARQQIGELRAITAGLVGALEVDQAERAIKERAYVAALNQIGVPLLPIADELEGGHS